VDRCVVFCRATGMLVSRAGNDNHAQSTVWVVPLANEMILCQLESVGTGQRDRERERERERERVSVCCAERGGRMSAFHTIPVYGVCGATVTRINGWSRYWCTSSRALLSASSTHSVEVAQLLGNSRMGAPTVARIPISSATAAVASGKKYMSLKQVAPQRTISCGWCTRQRVSERVRTSMAKVCLVCRTYSDRKLGAITYKVVRYPLAFGLPDLVQPLFQLHTRLIR
jgi:hypothetical protein